MLVNKLALPLLLIACTAFSQTIPNATAQFTLTLHIYNKSQIPIYVITRLYFRDSSTAETKYSKPFTVMNNNTITLKTQYYGEQLLNRITIDGILNNDTQFVLGCPLNTGHNEENHFSIAGQQCYFQSHQANANQWWWYTTPECTSTYNNEHLLTGANCSFTVETINHSP